MRLLLCAVLILLFTEATQAARTGHLFENLQQISLLPHFRLNRFFFLKVSYFHFHSQFIHSRVPLI